MILTSYDLVVVSTIILGIALMLIQLHLCDWDINEMLFEKEK